MPSPIQPERIAPDVWRFGIVTPLALGGRIVLRTNVYVIEAHDGLSLIDCGGTASYIQLRAAIARQFPGQPLRRVYLTHAHADHAGAAALCRAEGLEVFIGAGDTEMLLDGGPWGVPIKFRYPPCRPTGSIQAAGDIRLRRGGVLQVVPMPGHTPGSIGFVEADQRLLVTGDAVFGPCRAGFAGTFLLEVLTSWRQPVSELREQQDTLVRARGRFTASGGWLVLPGHGPVAEAGAFGDPLARAIRVISRVRPFARRKIGQ